VRPLQSSMPMSSSTCTFPSGGDVPEKPTSHNIVPESQTNSRASVLRISFDDVNFWRNLSMTGVSSEHWIVDLDCSSAHEVESGFWPQPCDVSTSSGSVGLDCQERSHEEVVDRWVWAARRSREVEEVAWCCSQRAH
jgi:hypothetical protein